MKKCAVKNCEKKVFGRFGHGGKYYCSAHYSHLRRHGKILRRHQRTPNRLVTNNKSTKIILYDKNSRETAVAKIDTEDVEKIRKYKWHLTKKGYVATHLPGGRLIHIQTIIIGPPRGKITDHILHDKLDNRKSKLRLVTYHENNINRKVLQSNNMSGCRGVHWLEKHKRWVAKINAHRKEIYLGRFVSVEEAKKARRRAEIKYWKEEAKYAIIK